MTSFLRCPKCQFAFPPDTATKPECPDCGSAMNIVSGGIPMVIDARGCQIPGVEYTEEASPHRLNTAGGDQYETAQFEIRTVHTSTVEGVNPGDKVLLSRCEPPLDLVQCDTRLHLPTLERIGPFTVKPEWTGNITAPPEVGTAGAEALAALNEP